MPRRKRETIKTEPDQYETTPPTTLPPSTPPQILADGISRVSEQADRTANVAHARPAARSFKAILSVPAKGVTLGERNGHDWVISFPADPGQEIKEALRDVGFEYRDRKWKVFTHAANRPAVEALARELKAEHGDEIAVNDYPVRQVVLAFNAPPGEEITSRLREADFHFRSDMTWNADHSPASQQFARDLIKSLPDQSRSAATGR